MSAAVATREPTKGRSHHGPGYGEAQRYFREVVLTYDGDECLFWPFGSVRGYGRVLYRGRQHIVSRLVCSKVNGPPPSPAHEAAHFCGNGRRGCVTKRHLSWKTRKENQADRLIHGTHNRGERQGASKLAEADVLAIRSMAGQSSQRDIAAKFRIGHVQVWRIINGETWKWLLNRDGPMSVAEKREFLNFLKILNSIDRDELEDAGVNLPDTVAWLKFRDDPYRWFIRACDADADKVWAIIERRQTR